MAIREQRLELAGFGTRALVLASRAPVHHVGGLLRDAADVRLETAPGGHLGVLTGRSAERTTWRTWTSSCSL